MPDDIASSTQDSFHEPERHEVPPPRGEGWRRVEGRRARVFLAEHWQEADVDMVNDLSREIRVLWPPAPLLGRDASTTPVQHHHVLDASHWEVLDSSPFD